VSAAELDLARVREVGVRAARAAGEVLRSRADSIREVRVKTSNVDIVTDVDLQSERTVGRILLEAFPSHTILGEEGVARGGDDRRYRWVVDPLDGTTNYAHGFPFYCVSIGLEVEAKLALGVVYSPSMDELFVAEAGRGATLNNRPIHVSDTDDLSRALLATGFPYDRTKFDHALRSFDALSRRTQAVRRVGSAALELCYVACGRLDAYWEHQIKPWDVAAGALLVTEAGGKISSTDGSPFSLEAGQVLSSNGTLHAAVVDALASTT
jgi:myo-inositol-1(or 4)-monophosphatase